MKRNAVSLTMAAAMLTGMLGSVPAFAADLSNLPDKVGEGTITATPDMYPDTDLSKPYTVNMYLIGDTPNDWDMVEEKINEYLVRGGRINWAIVPVMNETIVKSLSVEYIYDRFIKTIEGLIVAGTSEKLTYNRATISIQGDINSLPLIFAEKALIVANQVSKRIPVKS